MPIPISDAEAKAGNGQVNNVVQPVRFEVQNYEADGVVNKICYMLIRPPRFRYDPVMLEPKSNQRRFTMTTHLIPFPLTLYIQDNSRLVLLYLHGNSSSRMEGNLVLDFLPPQVGLACFDFRGCGNRDQQFITLGKKESQEVDIAAQYLKSLGHQVVGWGRSLGAVSLLMSRECDIMIVDSPFSSLSKLCKEYTERSLPPVCNYLITCMFPCLYSLLRSRIKSFSQLNIDDLEICTYIHNLNKHKQKKQICFIHGNKDEMISPTHSQQLHTEFEGKKMLLLFQGTHNSTRPQQVLNKAFQFVDNALEATKKYDLVTERHIQTNLSIKEREESVLKKKERAFTFKAIDHPTPSTCSSEIKVHNICKAVFSIEGEKVVKVNSQQLLQTNEEMLDSERRMFTSTPEKEETFILSGEIGNPDEKKSNKEGNNQEAQDSNKGTLHFELQAPMESLLLSPVNSAAELQEAKSQIHEIKKRHAGQDQLKGWSSFKKIHCGQEVQ